LRELLSEPLLSAAEAGALLGIPRSSVYDYAKRGELPHVRVGKHVKFIRQDLERVLAGRRVVHLKESRRRRAPSPPEVDVTPVETAGVRPE
jgi:excisionase family DNA binding protein